jgi:uncharacterized membrane protein
LPYRTRASSDAVVRSRDTLAGSISSDGETIAGIVDDESGESRSAFWSADDGWSLLDPIPLAQSSTATSLNANGTVIGAYLSNADDPLIPVRWTPSTGSVPLSGGFYISGISADGTVLSSANGQQGDTVTIWTTQFGARLLYPVLQQTGHVAALDGRELVGAQLSAAGNIVVGSASGAGEQAVPYRIDLNRLGWAEWDDR